MIIHPIFLRIGDEETEVAGDSEQQIVVPWLKRGKLVLEQLGTLFRIRALLSNLELDGLRKNFRRQIPQPGFEH